MGYTFGVALTEVLERIGIALLFRDREKTGADHTIIISDKESLALEDLQAEVWRKGIMAGRSVPDVVSQLVDASINFLGIKVKSARVKASQKVKERPKLRRVA